VLLSFSFEHLHLFVFAERDAEAILHDLGLRLQPVGNGASTFRYAEGGLIDPVPENALVGQGFILAAKGYARA